jgi:hypothetical protein
MTRTTLFAAALLGLLSSAASRADVEVAPPPREVGLDGKAPPAPLPEAAPRSTNPAETVEKIIQNSKAIADRLAETDTGAETRNTQDQTLALIDSLLNPDPPPPKPDDNQDKDKDQDQNKDQKDKDNKDQKQDNDPSGGKGGMPPPMGGGMSQPKDGMQPGDGSESKDRQQGRRPRAGSEQAKGKEPKQPKDAGKDPKGSAKADQKPDQGPMGGATAKKEPNPMGGNAGATGGVPKGPPTGPSLPLADDVVKDVWGSLPDRERQQLTQYYREQFMPRYSELLKQYFSSLAENTRKSSGEMKK